MTSASAPDEALVLAAIEQVWGSMLYASAEPWPADRPAEFESGLQAQIELRGEWNGRLVLTCDSEVATQIAGAMLGVGPDEGLEQPDVHDAVGEVLNVVGGSVKGALPGTSALGLPGVSEVTAVPSRGESFVVSWGDAPVYVQIVPDAA
ncbi:chemotaxis protein CheX [Nocardioides sp. YIM 152315]|uniref:chemotaxis protein CheX n=1 Tax=Nocardioides sp. YIM 152315 TaxID=3031760 RepID=UPI0023DA2519|nr:chemotaxis protein CheX [Nocardioides sp. YIM 152315]MDF1602344.1 chemotaxis protein CheX [Nocardioides sp. YIM 152315]